MERRDYDGLRRAAARLGALAFGPQMLAFLPALCLGAYWIGGEPALISVALGAPFVLLGASLAVRRAPAPGSDRDPETDLPLRPDTVEQTETILADGPTSRRTTASMAIEIDEFTETAERLGPGAGQIILHTCAERLRYAVRDDDLVFRLDGPRFGVILRAGARADLEGLIQLSTRVQKQMLEPIALDGMRVFVSVSVGFCVPRRVPGSGAEALIKSAEQALDSAVASGTGAIRAYSTDMQARARARGDLSEELPAALENGDIRPWFQPQVEIETGAVTGFEVLARWQHPKIGMVPPGEFLPVAEGLGLLERLGEVMLYQSLNSLRAWDASGIAVPNLSLNFSAEELRNPSIVDKIRWELDRFGIDPDRLTIEVLETVIAQTANDTIIRNLRAFAEMGCLIDLDDFGTGHASIANIRRFSVGRIKIDRSFVTQLDTDLEQQDIVSAIVTLAQRMGLDTLGEGVESPGEIAALRQLGCGHIQGYAIARPMPFEDVDSWVAEYRKRLEFAGTGPVVAPGRDQPARGKSA